MKKLFFLTAISAVTLLSSCNSDGWNDKQEEAFVNKCAEGFIKGFEKSSGTSVDKDKVDAFCKCSLEKVKADKKTFDDMTKLKAGELNKYHEPCYQEVFEGE